jgi:hypothetical protein
MVRAKFWLVVLARKKPFQVSPELSGDPQQDFGPDLNLAPLHNRQVVLANPNPPCKFLLRHVEAAEFAYAPPEGYPIHRDKLGFLWSHILVDVQSIHGYNIHIKT